MCRVRGLECGQKLLGPKTESVNESSAALGNSTVPRSVPAVDVGLLTESEIKFLQTYFHTLQGQQRFEWMFDNIDQLWFEETEFLKRTAWLTFGRNSTCLQYALLPLAIFRTKLNMFREYLHDDASQEMQLHYQLRSYSHLRLAITRGDNLEIFCSCLALINSALRLKRGGSAVIRGLLVHFSGLWAVTKLLLIDSSVTTAQKILYEWKFMTTIESARSLLADHFDHGCQTEECLAKIGETMTSILSEVLDWPMPSLPFVDGLDQKIRYRRLDLALYLRRLDPTSPGRRSLESDATLGALRSLTSIDVQIAFGIDKLLECLSGVGFPSSQFRFSLDWRSEFRVSRHLFYRVLELCISSDDPNTEVMKICYQLIAIFENAPTRKNREDRQLKEDILFLTGLYLTKSRHPTGNNYNPSKITDLF
jgi:hypothetical protein